MKSVSVIVPSRGGAGRLPTLLQAFENQQTAARFDVHVIVDGDIDKSEDVLKGLKQEFPTVDLSWTVFPENRGRVAALNRGIEATSGEVIARCDDDLVPAADYIDIIATSHGEVVKGLVGLYLNRYPETPYSRAYGKPRDQMFREEAYHAPPSERWIYWHGNSSARREVMAEVGLYDPRFRKYGWEDVDYGYRLFRAGVPIELEPALETEHRVAATTTEIRALRALHAGTAKRAFLEKHGLAEPPALRGIWGRAVAMASTLQSERILGHSARLVDRILPAAPSVVGEKAVAFLVESGGYSGFKYPDRARSLF